MKRILRSSITYIVVFIVALIISLYHYGFRMKNTQDVLGFLLAVDQYVSEIYKGNPADEVPLLEAYNKLDCRAIQEEIENYLIL